MFETALPDPFCAEPTCGASAALRAFVSAPKVRHAQIQHICAALVFSKFSVCCVLFTSLPGLFCAEPACGASAALRALSPPQRHSTRRFSSPVLFAFSMSCVFWNALPGPLSAGVACGASLALRALIPAPRAQDAGCRMEVANVTVHLIWPRSSSSLRLTVTPYSIYIHAHPIIPVHVYWALHRRAQMEIPGRCSAVWYDPSQNQPSTQFKN